MAQLVKSCLELNSMVSMYSEGPSTKGSMKSPTPCLPGCQEMTTTPDFKKGDPYVKVDQGFARLPGPGYQAIHPEINDINPEDYPDINKLAILADVAPYSREYNTYRFKVGKQAQGNTELEIEYEKILDRVRQTSLSVLPHTKTPRTRRRTPASGCGIFRFWVTSTL
jgi:hypothetical protein